MAFVYEVGKPFPDASIPNQEGGCIRFLEVGFEVLFIFREVEKAVFSAFASDKP